MRSLYQKFQLSCFKTEGGDRGERRRDGQTCPAHPAHLSMQVICYMSVALQVNKSKGLSYKSSETICRYIFQVYVLDFWFE